MNILKVLILQSFIQKKNKFKLETKNAFFWVILGQNLKNKYCNTWNQHNWICLDT